MCVIIMNKILVLGFVCLVIIGVIGFVNYYETEEPAEEIIEEIYEEKEALYAPIECFLNETHYDTKCVEDYING